MVRVRTANALSEMASGFDSLSLRQDLEAKTPLVRVEPCNKREAS